MSAGTMANDLAEALERSQRGLRLIRQYFTVAPHPIEDAGRVPLGLPANDPLLSMR